MTKKPSEWTAQEAWRESAQAHEIEWSKGCGWPRVLFPEDPPEVASDNAIDDILAHRAHHLSVTVLMMARELKERRARDKP